jgi:hypothetical protein
MGESKQIESGKKQRNTEEGTVWPAECSVESTPLWSAWAEAARAASKEKPEEGGNQKPDEESSERDQCKGDVTSATSAIARNYVGYPHLKREKQKDCRTAVPGYFCGVVIHDLASIIQTIGS